MSNYDLGALYDLYIKYLQDLAEDSGRECPIRDYIDFVSWWNELSPAVQRRSEANYRKGYAAVIREGKRQVAELVLGTDAGDK